jgi:hypothetical protein
MASVSASFLNLDLELESDRDLAPLAEHFGHRAFVLQCNEDGGRFHLALEPLLSGALCGDPTACTDAVLDLIHTLPPALRELWQQCSVRLFDYGYDGGLEAPPLTTDIDPVRLGLIAAAGAGIRITLYPFRQSPSAGDNEGDADA